MTEPLRYAEISSTGDVIGVVEVHRVAGKTAKVTDVAKTAGPGRTVLTVTDADTVVPGLTRVEQGQFVTPAEESPA